MLADQARYDDAENDGTSDGFVDSGEVELTDDNADQFINFINNMSRG